MVFALVLLVLARYAAGGDGGLDSALMTATPRSETGAVPTLNSCIFVVGTSPRALARGCAATANARTVSTTTARPPRLVTDLLVAAAAPGVALCASGPVELTRLVEARVCRVRVFVEFPLDAAVDPNLSGRAAPHEWAAAFAPESEDDTEDWIDRICARRRHDNSTLCSIREIPLLRAARKWDIAAREAVDLVASISSPSPPLSLLSSSSTAAACEIAPLARVGSDLAVSASEDDNGSSSRGTTPVSGGPRPPEPQRLLHRALVRDLVGADGSDSGTTEAAVRVLFDEATIAHSLRSAPDEPLEPPIDAGSCWIVRGASANGAYARCLPSFLIVGAQKAGTDELAVWLNFNVYHRRMDGGPETHFFDCVGRGRGQSREPCFRGRSAEMMLSQSSPQVAHLDPNSTSSRFWSWDRVRRSVRFNRVDELWERYMRLGQLDRRRYHISPSRALVYEKTPSYSDLAHPRDVARLLPSARIVFISRDPVARLYSSYWQACQDSPGSRRRCSVERYEELVLELIRDGGVGSRVDPEFRRAAEHGFYAKSLRPWFETFAAHSRNRVLVVDAHHFHYLPQAVVFAVESFVGNRGGTRHHEYNPSWRDGYWVLGDYSKANHPSHTSRAPLANITSLLERWYQPHILEWANLLKEYEGRIALGAVGEHFPSEIRGLHPTLFGTGINHNNFGEPPWLRTAVERVGGSS